MAQNSIKRQKDRMDSINSRNHAALESSKIRLKQTESKVIIPHKEEVNHDSATSPTNSSSTSTSSAQQNQESDYEICSPSICNVSGSVNDILRIGVEKKIASSSSLLNFSNDSNRPQVLKHTV